MVVASLITYSSLLAGWCRVWNVHKVLGCQSVSRMAYSILFSYLNVLAPKQEGPTEILTIQSWLLTYWGPTDSLRIETHLVGEVVSTFIFPLANTACFNSTVVCIMNVTWWVHCRTSHNCIGMRKYKRVNAISVCSTIYSVRVSLQLPPLVITGWV